MYNNSKFFLLMWTTYIPAVILTEFLPSRHTVLQQGFCESQYSANFWKKQTKGGTPKTYSDTYEYESLVTQKHAYSTFIIVH